MSQTSVISSESSSHCSLERYHPELWAQPWDKSDPYENEDDVAEAWEGLT